MKISPPTHVRSFNGGTRKHQKESVGEKGWEKCVGACECAHVCTCWDEIVHEKERAGEKEREK